MHFILVIITSLLIISSAIAHDWYPSKCCGGQDCKPVPCDALIEQKDGTVKYEEDGIKYHFGQPLPSEDSKCHVCIRPAFDGETTPQPMCVFTLQSF